MDRPGFHQFVGRRLEAAGLEGIVAHVTQERSGVEAGGVHEWGLLARAVVHKQLGDDRGR